MEKYKHIDLGYLKSISKGDAEFMVKVIDTFIIQEKADIQKLHEFIKEGKWESIFLIAHKMKPSFQFVGIKELQEVLENIELHAREKTNMDLVSELAIQVSSIYEASVLELIDETGKIIQ